MKGAPVVGIKSSFAYEGRLQACFDKFIQESQPPAQSRKGIYAPALKTTLVAPATVGGVNSSDAASKFGAAHAGLYYYASAGINKDGHSNITKSSQSHPSGSWITETRVGSES
jgi:hypothetical protein